MELIQCQQSSGSINNVVRNVIHAEHPLYIITYHAPLLSSFNSSSLVSLVKTWSFSNDFYVTIFLLLCIIKFLVIGKVTDLADEEPLYLQIVPCLLSCYRLLLMQWVCQWLLSWPLWNVSWFSLHQKVPFFSRRFFLSKVDYGDHVWQRHI